MKKSFDQNDVIDPDDDVITFETKKNLAKELPLRVSTLLKSQHMAKMPLKGRSSPGKKKQDMQVSVTTTKSGRNCEIHFNGHKTLILQSKLRV